MPVNVIEPHPSVPQNPKKKAYLSTGRGGAGNFSSHNAASLTAGPTASGPASRVAAPTAQSSPSKPPQTIAAASTQTQKPKYSSGGIGGAGNFVPASERCMFSFDEELERQQRMEDARSSTPVFHFGRGGAGNLATPKTQRGSTASQGSGSGSGSSNASVTSAEAGAARMNSRFGKMIRALSNSRE